MRRSIVVRLMFVSCTGELALWPYCDAAAEGPRKAVAASQGLGAGKGWRRQRLAAAAEEEEAEEEREVAELLLKECRECGEKSVDELEEDESNPGDWYCVACWEASWDTPETNE